jgi:hypothetical protein
VALIRTVSEDRIASIFRVHECEQILIRATRCHLPEDDNHHSHRRGNLKSYTNSFVRNCVRVFLTMKLRVKNRYFKCLQLLYKLHR